MSDERRKAYRSTLIDLFGSATASDRYVTDREVVHAGIPKRFALQVSRNSREITSEADAVAAAEEWATYIDANVEDFDVMTPTELAALVRRF